MRLHGLSRRNFMAGSYLITLGTTGDDEAREYLYVLFSLFFFHFDHATTFVRTFENPIFSITLSPTLD